MQASGISWTSGVIGKQELGFNKKREENLIEVSEHDTFYSSYFRKTNLILHEIFSRM